MRILLSIHHRLDPNLGAPGITLALANALEGLGHEVTTFGFGEAWPGLQQPSVKHAVVFPYKAAGYVLRNRSRFDVLDMSTGDAHWWPLAKTLMRDRPALVTRSHGLEHLAAERVRADAARGAIKLSRKYNIYHGGIRLREVARSIRSADAAIVSNDVDRAYVIDNLNVRTDRVVAIPNGVRQDFLDAPRERPATRPLQLVWIARWTSSKGSLEMIEALNHAVRAGAELDLLVLGTSDADVLASLDEQVRPFVHVVPEFLNADLPTLLADREVFVFPSHSEGFSMALIETMALGLAPLATPVGGAPVLIDHGVNGLLTPVHDAKALGESLVRLAGDRDHVFSMGLQAKETARAYSWDRIAQRTVEWYEHARELMAAGR